MTDKRFEELVAEAMDRIPRFFQEEMPEFFDDDVWNQNIVVQVEDEPSPEVLADLGIEPPDSLYGLYEGTPGPERGTRPLPQRMA